jgi:hypothetical protein
MSHFYLTLPSDSSSKYYPENTAASFKTKLSDRIDLDGQYEVGLAQFIYPHSWYNFNNSDKGLYITFHPDDEEEGEISLVFRSGQFPDEKTFVHVLNDWISTAEIYGCTFSWDQWDRRIRVLISNKNGSIYMSRGLANLLGFEDVGPYKTHMTSSGLIPQYYEATYTFDLRVGLRMIYVYSDIVSHTLVGDTKVPILRVCATEGRYGEMVAVTFTEPHYVPLARNELDTIDILINNELGKPVPFEYGKSVVTLHFRRRNKLLL